MENQTLLLIGVGIALLIASVGMYAQPPVEQYQPNSIELDTGSELNLTDAENPDGYVPAEEKWWSVSTAPELNDPLQEEPPATALTESQSEGFVFTTSIAGFLFVVSGLMRKQTE